MLPVEDLRELSNHQQITQHTIKQQVSTDTNIEEITYTTKTTCTRRTSSTAGDSQ